jgi:hypothetical protein
MSCRNLTADATDAVLLPELMQGFLGVRALVMF